MELVCVICAGEYIVAETKRAAGHDIELPEVAFAWTLVPVWQDKLEMSSAGMQKIVACVALPTCKKHMVVEQLSPAEQAVRGGKILQATVNPK